MAFFFFNEDFLLFPFLARLAPIRVRPYEEEVEVAHGDFDRVLLLVREPVDDTLLTLPRLPIELPTESLDRDEATLVPLDTEDRPREVLLLPRFLTSS